MPLLALRSSLILQVLLSISLPLAASAHLPAAGPVAAYGFEEGSGGTAADSSGNAHTGTITGASWTSQGRFGNALVFDGVDDVVEITGAADLSPGVEMTLSAWVYPTALGASPATILHKQPGGWFLRASSAASVPAGGATIGGGPESLQAAASLAVDEWSHLALVYDGATLEFYVNGLVVASTPAAGLLDVSVMPIRIGATDQPGEAFAGRIDEVRVHNFALTLNEVQSIMATSVEPVGPDAAPPSVSIVSPTDGALVSNTISITADATDDVGVVGVQFQVDGSDWGSEDLVPPYVLPLDTYLLGNGSHVFTAIARDVANNLTASTSVTVVVDNVVGPDPAVYGEWGPVLAWPVVSVHGILTHMGEVLLWTDRGVEDIHVFNPVTTGFVTAPYPSYQLFCAGHSQLPDGRILVTGGDTASYVGIEEASIFDPVTYTWERGPQMAYRRWYPTNVSLGDGRALVLSGSEDCSSCIAEIPEIYDPDTNSWTQLNSAPLPVQLYPHTFLLPDGRVLVTGTQVEPIATFVLDLETETWSTVDARILQGGSSVMYRPGQVLKTGTGWNPDFNPIDSENGARVIDMSDPSPAWREVAPMAFARTQHVLTSLPDGKVLVTGGSRNTDVFDESEAVFEAEIWDPDTELWTTLSSGSVPRMYHSTAILLPDARVLVSGGGAFGPNQRSAQIFSPPYLFQGQRPTIATAPNIVSYGSTFYVTTPDAGDIATVSLIRYGSVTHAFNQDQRWVPLSFTTNGSSLAIEAPIDGNLAPPGYYMMFISDGQGVPSVAAKVRITDDTADNTPPNVSLTAPADGSTVLGSPLLAASATDDYEVAGVQFWVDGTALGPEDVTPPYEAFWDTSLEPNGPHTLTATARDPTGNTATSAPVGVILDNPPDSTPPSVAMTSPPGGATLSGVAMLTADASDDVAVVGVQFFADGQPIGEEDFAPPYQALWNTHAFDGPYTLRAQARDAAGNVTTSAGVAITVSSKP